MRFLREGQTLNKVEKIKLQRHPLDVQQSIIDTYSKDLSAMDDVPGEVERLKWVGIYPQKQGGDAFMMRVKVPGGVLTPEQTVAIGRIASDFARGPIPNPHFGNNFLDLPARLEDGTLGFNLRVGGGLSDGPRMASDIDVFVRPEEAVEITRGIAQVFGELGDRENRWTARMRYLVQELGPEAFREELAKRVSLGLTPAGEDLTKRYRGDHIGVHPQRGRGGSETPPYVFVGLNVPVGRVSGGQF